MASPKEFTYYLLDDEELARMRLDSLIQECELPFVKVGESSKPISAISEIIEYAPDVLFLDIQMPKLDGFDVVEALGEHLPKTIFVTAFDHYAIKAFEVHALDYLTKPVHLDRLKLSMHRFMEDYKKERSAISSMLDDRKPKPKLQVLSIHRAGRTEITEVDKIHHFTVDDKTVFAHLEKGIYRVNFTLSELDNRLNDAVFYRIHRSKILNLRFIHEIYIWKNGQYRVKLKDGSEHDISRRRSTELKSLLSM